MRAASACLACRRLTASPPSAHAQYTAEEKEQGLDMPAKLFAANTLNERSKHGSNAALDSLAEAKATPA